MPDAHTVQIRFAVLASRLALLLILISSPLSIAGIPIVTDARSAALSAEQQEHEELRVFLKQAVADAGSFKDRFDAEVWLFDMSGRMTRYIKDPQERLTFYAACTERRARQD